MPVVYDGCKVGFESFVINTEGLHRKRASYLPCHACAFIIISSVSTKCSAPNLLPKSCQIWIISASRFLTLTRIVRKCQSEALEILWETKLHRHHVGFVERWDCGCGGRVGISRNSSLHACSLASLHSPTAPLTPFAPNEKDEFHGFLASFHFNVEESIIDKRNNILVQCEISLGARVCVCGCVGVRVCHTILAVKSLDCFALDCGCHPSRITLQEEVR